MHIKKTLLLFHAVIRKASRATFLKSHLLILLSLANYLILLNNQQSSTYKKIIYMEIKRIIRLIKSTDIPEVLEIYEPFVMSTSITPEYDVESLQKFSTKIKSISDYYPVLVCEVNKKMVGYTYANKYRLAQGHLWSAESTIYLSPDYYGKGVAKNLYQSLFAILKLQNFINVFAGIVLPNKRSEMFHENLGFQKVGIFKKGIYKLGNWHDVKWFQLSLAEHIKNPVLPKSFKEVMNTIELENILK